MGKFAKLRDAYKAARARRQAHDTPATRAVEGYMQRARAASIILANMRGAPMTRSKPYLIGQTVALRGTTTPQVITDVRYDEARGEPHYRVAGNECWYGHEAFAPSPPPAPVDPADKVARALRIAAAYDAWSTTPGERQLLDEVIREVEQEYQRWLSQRRNDDPPDPL